MVEIFRRIGSGGGRSNDYDKMQMLGKALQYSNCIHGSASPTIMLKSVEFFREEIDEHINERRCRAQVCADMIRYEITGSSDKLTEAEAICPTEAITQEDEKWSIDQAKCIRCNACKEVAPDDVRIVDALTGVLPLTPVAAAPAG